MRFYHYLDKPLGLRNHLILFLGFDYQFNAIQNENNELFNAYKDMFEIAVSQPGMIRKAIGTYVPILERVFVSFYLSPAMRC